MPASYTPDTAVIDTTFQADAFDVLELDVPGAHVRLRPHNEDDRVHLRGTVPNLETAKAEALFDRKDISTRPSGDRLHVSGKALSGGVEEWRWRHGHRTAVRMEVRLPPTLTVTTNTPGGSVDAAHLSGSLSASVRGGSISATGLTGPVQIQGSGGALTMRECSGPTLNLQWSAGEVSLIEIEEGATTLRAAAAPTTVQTLHGPADLSVHGAPLTLRDLEGPSEAETQGGALTYHGAPEDDTSLRAVGAPLQTHLPSSHAATLTLAGAQVALDDRFAFDGERTARRIEGTLNGGGPSLQLRAVQGPARCIVKRDA
ncbi:MAG: hypothetical protein ABEL51_04490 [Salinibacter sp.]